MKRNLLIPATLLALGLTAFGQKEDLEKAAPPKPAPPSTNGDAPATAVPKGRFPAATPASPAGGNFGGGGFGGMGGAGGSASAGALYGGGGVGYTVGPSASSSSGIAPLIVRFSGGDEATNAVLEEDLNIMGHLIEHSLQNAVADGAPEVKSGIPILLSDARSVRGMYLDGFGAMFMIKVRFPVFAPSVPEPKEPPPPASDSEWDRAKRELYGEAEGRSADMALMGGGSQYDAGQVEELKTVLLQTLKSASNIHNLKPDDFIAITVFGQPSAFVSARKSRVSRSDSSNLFSPTPTPPRTELSLSRQITADKIYMNVDPDQKPRAGTAAREVAIVLRGPSQGSVLTLRVRRSDVDAFAKGKLDFEAFQKKAEQNSYLGSGYGVTSINSWSKIGNSRSTGAQGF